MKDGMGRNIDYMRISITDRCNLRCRYCMPDGIQSLPRREILTLEEIEMTAVCAARLGDPPYQDYRRRASGEKGTLSRYSSM